MVASLGSRASLRAELEYLAHQQLPSAVVPAFLVGFCPQLAREALRARFARHGPATIGLTGGWLFDWAAATARPRPRGGMKVFDKPGSLSQRLVVCRTATWIWQQTGRWPGWTDWGDGRPYELKRGGGSDVELLRAVLDWVLTHGPAGLTPVRPGTIVRWVKGLRRASRTYFARCSQAERERFRQVALPWTGAAGIGEQWARVTVPVGRPIRSETRLGSLPPALHASSGSQSQRDEVSLLLSLWKDYREQLVRVG
jgi:hypothetical protein